MKTKTLGWMVALGLVGTAFGACSQPKTDCQVALASTNYSYAVKYTVKNTPSAACQALVKPGEMFGMEFYHPANSDGTSYDSTKTTIAIQSEDLFRETQNRESDEAHKPYGEGAFTTATPDASNFCLANMTTSAEQDFPKQDAMMGTGGDDPGTPALAARTVKYEWSNLKFFVTAAAPGTQFSGDLKYTDTTDTGETCTIEYATVGIWPAAGCAAYDADGNITGPDDTLCNPCANPDAGITIGSGISPDFPTRCDPDLLLCVLTDAKVKTQNATSIPQILATSIDCGPVD